MQEFPCLRHVSALLSSEEKEALAALAVSCGLQPFDPDSDPEDWGRAALLLRPVLSIWPRHASETLEEPGGSDPSAAAGSGPLYIFDFDEALLQSMSYTPEELLEPSYGAWAGEAEAEAGGGGWPAYSAGSANEVSIPVPRPAPAPMPILTSEQALQDRFPNAKPLRFGKLKGRLGGASGPETLAAELAFTLSNSHKHLQPLKVR